MRIRYNSFVGNTRATVDVKGTEVRIGRAADNEVVLDNPFIPDRALLLQKIEGGWHLQVMAPNGCKMGERQLRNGDYVAVDLRAPLQVFPFTLELDTSDEVQVTAEMRRAEREREMTQTLLAVHLALLDRLGIAPGGSDDRKVDDAAVQSLEKTLEDVTKYCGLYDAKNAHLCAHTAGNCVRAEMLGGLIAGQGKGGGGLPASLMPERGWSRLLSAVPERERELRQAVDYVGNQIGYKKLDDLTAQIDAVEKTFWPHWEKIADRMHADLKGYLAGRFVKKEIKDIVYGYGPLEDLLRNPAVSEIMVVDRDHIYVEKAGVLEITGRRFISDEVTESIIQRIVARVNKQVDRSRPLVDARLTDGSRVNAVIPPIAVRGPCLTIRKFPLRRLTVDDLLKKGSMSPTVAQFLAAAVNVRCNIICSGGTGSGKTTLLNCLSNFIPDKERIVTIEDTAELQLQKEHVVRLEAKEANMEGAGAYTIRDLVKNSLRMRPDRLVIGECRGGEALDMLQAMNTGHDGSLTTLHANTSEDVILRLEVMCQMAADLPVESIRRQIASAVHLIVQLRRLHDGTRRVVQVSEVTGFDEKDKMVKLKDIFILETIDGKPELMPTGSLPSFMGHLLESGLLSLDALYRNSAANVAQKAALAADKAGEAKPAHAA